MGRIAAVALVVFGWMMWLPGTAHAAPHTFDGACQLTGLVSGTFADSMGMSYTFEGSGTCTGRVDGQMLQDTPISVRSTGHIQSFLVPVLGDGMGKLMFTKAMVTYPIRIEQIGTVLRTFVMCMGCEGSALGTFEPVTETQPGPDRAGPRTAIRIVTGTTATFRTP